MGMWTPLSASLSAISPQGAPVRASQCSVLSQCSDSSHACAHGSVGSTAPCAAASNVTFHRWWFYCFPL